MESFDLMDPPDGPKASVSLSQRAYASIRGKIVALELAPGAVIDEALLQEELEFGRTPIREALQRLEREKLVTILPRRGMFVSEIGITDLPRLFEIRLVLEGLAAELAALRGTEIHFDEMEKVLAYLPQGEGEIDNKLLIAIDERSHYLIYQAADNIFLQDTLATLYTLSLRLWYFSLAQIGGLQGAVREHHAIYQAIRARDPIASSNLLRQHIQTFQDEIQAAMIGSATPRLSNS